MSFEKGHHQLFEEGIVVDVVREHKEWRIQVYGVFWFAKANTNLNFHPGDVVRIIGRQGTKLIIDQGEFEG